MPSSDARQLVKQGVLSLICDYCGKSFSRNRSQIRPGSQTFCDQECKKKALKGTTRPCINCNEPVYFTPTRWESRRSDTPVYCSEKACQASKLIVVKCNTCEGTYQITPSAFKRNKTGRFFCTTECAKGPNSRGAQRTGKQKVCERDGCEVEFYVPPSLESRKRFCSKSCQKNRIQRTCLLCGKEHEVRASHAGTGDYCSVTCASIAKMKNAIRGESCNGRPKRWHSGRGSYVQVYAPDHPNSQASGWAFEHRIVAADFIAGRPLRKDEEVDHKNQIKFDNRPENLAIVSKRDHQKKTAQDAAASRAIDRKRLKLLEDLCARFPAEMRELVLEVGSEDDLEMLYLTITYDHVSNPERSELQDLLEIAWKRLGSR